MAAVFQDFNFKLLVVEKLMYEDETLTPRFSIAEHLRGRGVTDVHEYVVTNGLAHKVLDEARAYFEALEIDDELLATVDELVIDGGNEVYTECAPVWDGEDDLFDVHSLDDLALVPNLRSIVGAEECGLAVPNKLEILQARGIAAD